MPDHVTPGGRSIGIVARRIVTAAIALVLAAFAGALPATAAAATGPAGPVVIAGSAAADGEVIAGVDVDEAVDALGSDHVAVLDSGADEDGLVEVVADARAQGINLSVVSAGTSPTEADTKALSDTLLKRVGGTVLVLTKTKLAVSSDEVSQAQADKAKTAAQSGGSDDVASARAAADSLTAKSFPWTLVIIGVIIAVIVIAIAGRFWEKRRKQRADAGALAELTENLKNRVGKLAPLIIGISPRIEIAQRPDLEDKFNVASSDYNELLTTLSTPLASRKEVDATTARVADLEKRITDIDAQLDAAAPGMAPPSPAG